MKIFIFAGCALFGLFNSQMVSAQATLPKDSVAIASAVAAASQHYAAATNLDSRLLSGTEYTYRAKPFMQGNPFFPTPNVQPGSLQYDGFTFEAVQMRYDCRADLVVVQPTSRAITLKLVTEKVASFTLSGHHFVRIVTDSVASPQLHTGFYDLLADGPARLLAKHSKKGYERPTQAGMEGRFVETIRFFIQQGDAYAEVAKLKDVTALFPARKSDLQKYARSQRLSFKEGNREYGLATLMRHYNSLAN